jgi:hypothetical protein
MLSNRERPIDKEQKAIDKYYVDKTKYHNMVNEI